jgi:hypothetical protein
MRNIKCDSYVVNLKVILNAEGGPKTSSRHILTELQMQRTIIYASFPKSSSPLSTVSTASRS